MCTQKPPRDWSAALYAKYRSVFEGYLRLEVGGRRALAAHTEQGRAAVLVMQTPPQPRLEIGHTYLESPHAATVLRYGWGCGRCCRCCRHSLQGDELLKEIMKRWVNNEVRLSFTLHCLGQLAAAGRFV